MDDWKIFQGTRTPEPTKISELPSPPKWRDFLATEASGSSRLKEKGKTFQAQKEAIELVNAALYLRRPLLVTGKPGTGKSSLAYAVAYELGLGEVLYWPITTKSTIKDGQYSYDAIGRVQDAQQKGKGQDSLQDIGRYITLGPLGTALLPSEKPRVLLIDEIDKSDIDLPNDLLHVFEEGQFLISELVRIADKLSEVEVLTAFTETGEPTHAKIPAGRVRCTHFPFVVLTSNGERDFPPPFLRRCVRLTMPEPTDPQQLRDIIKAHLGEEAMAAAEELITKFLERQQDSLTKGDIATDQLLNAVYMLVREQAPTGDDRERMINHLLKHLSSTQDT